MISHDDHFSAKDGPRDGPRMATRIVPRMVPPMVRMVPAGGVRGRGSRGRFVVPLGRLVLAHSSTLWAFSGVPARGGEGGGGQGLVEHTRTRLPTSNLRAETGKPKLQISLVF